MGDDKDKPSPPAEKPKIIRTQKELDGEPMNPREADYKRRLHETLNPRKPEPATLPKDPRKR